MLKKIVFSFCFMVSSIYAFDPEYSNTVTAIQEIHGACSYSLVLQCSCSDPIIVYAPANYAESLNSEIQRFFMPETTLEDEVSSPSGSVVQVGSGVEIVIFGELNEKIVNGSTIVLTVLLHKKE